MIKPLFIRTRLRRRGRELMRRYSVLVDHFGDGGQPHQMARICERLRFFDPSKLDMDAPVFADMDEVEEAEESKFEKDRK